MQVLLKKTKSKDGVGLFPVGFEVSGVLVDVNGVEIEPGQLRNGSGVYIRVKVTAFADKPYQFATDAIINIALVQTHYVVDTSGSVWILEKIS